MRREGGRNQENLLYGSLGGCPEQRGYTDQRRPLRREAGLGDLRADPTLLEETQHVYY